MSTTAYAASVQGISIRVTRLNDEGELLGGPSDSFTTSAFIRVSFTPEYEDGEATAQPALYRLALVPSGETLADQHYIVYDASLPAYSSDYHTAGITLAAGDKVIVQSNVIGVSVTVCGDES